MTPEHEGAKAVGFEKWIARRPDIDAQEMPGGGTLDPRPQVTARQDEREYRHAHDHDDERAAEGEADGQKDEIRDPGLGFLIRCRCDRSDTAVPMYNPDRSAAASLTYSGIERPKCRLILVDKRI